MTVKELRKMRTKATAEAIIEKTKNIDPDSLLSDIFVWTDKPITQKMIKLYESQIGLARFRPIDFVMGLESFYQNTAKFITDNKLEKEFLSFCYFVYSSISLKEKATEASLYCYLDLLMQQFDYFISHPNIIYGLDTQNHWMIRPEPFPNIDIALYETPNHTPVTSLEMALSSLRQYGYNAYSVHDIDRLRANDELITNMLLTISPFISEYTKDIIPDNYYLVAHGFSMPRRVNPTKVYKELLHEKRYFLPRKGVKGIYYNSLEIAEIAFQEIFAENRIILLYKVTDKHGRGFCGFYDNKLEFFFSPWRDSDGGKMFHNDIENFILESYCYLTTDIEEKENELNLNKRLYIIKKDEAEAVSSLPTVKFLYEKEQDGHDTQKDTGQVEFRIFDKKKYKEIKMQFGGRPRKLPAGAHASEEALRLAKEYNYVIKPGETFVRPFERRVYVKKDKPET